MLRLARVVHSSAVAGLCAGLIGLVGAACVPDPPPAPSITELTNGNGTEFQPTVSADGSVVAFVTTSDDLGHADPDGAAPTIVTLDRATGVVESVAPWTTDSAATVIADGVGARTIELDLSADGRYLAFRTNAAVIGSDVNGTDDVYVYDRVAHSYERASVAVDPGSLGNVSISDDGSLVGFMETDGPAARGYRYHRGTGTLDIAFAGGIPSFIGGGPLSRNGRYEVLTTNEQWDPSDTDSQDDCYVADLATGVRTLVPTADTTVLCRDAQALDDGGAVVSVIRSEPGGGFLQDVVVWHPGATPTSYPVEAISTAVPEQFGGVPVGVGSTGGSDLSVTIGNLAATSAPPVTTFTLELDTLATGPGTTTPILADALGKGSDTSTTGRYIVFSNAAGHLQLWDRGA